MGQGATGDDNMTANIGERVASLDTRIENVEDRVGVLEKDREILTTLRIEVSGLAAKIVAVGEAGNRDSRINRTILILICGGLLGLAWYIIQSGIAMQAGITP